MQQHSRKKNLQGLWGVFGGQADTLIHRSPTTLTHWWGTCGFIRNTLVGPGGSTPLPGGCQGCAQRRQRPRCGAEASPLRIMAPIPGPFPESCPGQQLAP